MEGVVVKRLVAPTTYVVMNDVSVIDVDTSSGGITNIILQKIVDSAFRGRITINDVSNNASVGKIVIYTSGGNLINNVNPLTLDNDGIIAEVEVSDRNRFIANLNTDDITLVTGDKNFDYTQPVPNSVWTVSHNLGKKCSVNITDLSEKEIVGEVEYANLNEVIVRFNTPKTGKVYCN